MLDTSSHAACTHFHSQEELRTLESCRRFAHNTWHRAWVHEVTVALEDDPEVGQYLATCLKNKDSLAGSELANGPCRGTGASQC